MFSKATLIGVVGIEPRYKPAADGKDSIIAFRLGCKVFTTSKEITEWYTIKAFGAVADYLYNNIKKDSNVFLEASIRNRRWVIDGVERQGIEFHAFTARAMPDSDVKQNYQDTTLVKANNSQELPFPEAEKTTSIEAHQSKPVPKPLTAEEARQVADRFRKTFELRKKEVEQKQAAKTITGSDTTDYHSINESNGNVGMPEDIIQSRTITAMAISRSTGNSFTDSILNARNAIRSKLPRADSHSGESHEGAMIESCNSFNSNSNGHELVKGYAQVRGGWSNRH
ncbi:single-stranded DNA-binding protein [Cronobacter dublinensis subsp. dublinensis]|nr:single-stranded DNA-binding protein [Cronobacter dublinensis subsp. dublinensis]